MASKRTRDLDAAASLIGSYFFALDDAGFTEQKKATLSEFRDLVLTSNDYLYLSDGTTPGTYDELHFGGSKFITEASIIASSGVNLGAQDQAFQYIFLCGETVQGDGSIKFTATPTTSRTITFPDATGTVALTSDLTTSNLDAAAALSNSDYLRVNQGAADKKSTFADVAKLMQSSNNSVWSRIIDTEFGGFGENPFYRRVEYITGVNAAILSVNIAASSAGTVGGTVVSETLGHGANIASSGSGNSTFGVQGTTVSLIRGSTTGYNGFFLAAIVGFPDADYNSSGASTGSRLVVGATDQNTASQVNSDNPSGHRAFFSRCHVNGGLTDTNWYFSTKDGTTENRVSTGMAFTATHLYAFFIYCPPQGTTIYWKIFDLTAGTSQEGSTGSNLPGASTQMYMTVKAFSVNAVTRNIRHNMLYSSTKAA